MEDSPILAIDGFWYGKEHIFHKGNNQKAQNKQQNYLKSGGREKQTGKKKRNKKKKKPK